MTNKWYTGRCCRKKKKQGRESKCLTGVVMLKVVIRDLPDMAILGQ
jgi:hypothetical protein